MIKTKLSEQDIENQVIDEVDFNHSDDIHEAVEEGIIINIKDNEKRKAFPKNKNNLKKQDDATIIDTKTKHSKTKKSNIKRNILIAFLITATASGIVFYKHTQEKNKNNTTENNLLEIILNENQKTK